MAEEGGWGENAEQPPVIVYVPPGPRARHYRAALAASCRAEGRMVRIANSAAEARAALAVGWEVVVARHTHKADLVHGVRVLEVRSPWRGVGALGGAGLAGALLGWARERPAVAALLAAQLLVLPAVLGPDQGEAPPPARPPVAVPPPPQQPPVVPPASPTPASPTPTPGEAAPEPPADGGNGGEQPAPPVPEPSPSPSPPAASTPPAAPPSPTPSPDPPPPPPTPAPPTPSPPDDEGPCVELKLLVIDLRLCLP